MALPVTLPTNHRGTEESRITRSEVRKSKSGCVVALACLSPLGLSSHFQALEGSAKRRAQSTDLEAGDQYTHLSYLEPAVRSKPRVFFLHNKGMAVTYWPSLLCRSGCYRQGH